MSDSIPEQNRSTDTIQPTQFGQLAQAETFYMAGTAPAASSEHPDAPAGVIVSSIVQNEIGDGDDSTVVGTVVLDAITPRTAMEEEDDRAEQSANLLLSNTLTAHSGEDADAVATSLSSMTYPASENTTKFGLSSFSDKSDNIGVPETSSVSQHATSFQSSAPSATPGEMDWMSSFTDPSIARIFVNRLFNRLLEGKPWHTGHYNDRRLIMQKCIVKLIKRKSAPNMNISNDFVPDEKLSNMAELMERYLYDTADSFEEYFNANTLIHRIKEFTMKYVQEAREEHSRSLISQANASSMATKGFVQGSSVMDTNNLPVGTTVMVSTQDDAMKLAVSSQGCSRVFILKILHRLDSYLKENPISSVFSIRKDIVSKWLDDVRLECSGTEMSRLEASYGGSPFHIDDAQTHWTEPSQLYTWWKNNIDRKSKFKVLQEDARYDGSDIRKIQRSKWCEEVVELVTVIRTLLNKYALQFGESGVDGNASVASSVPPQAQPATIYTAPSQPNAMNMPPPPVSSVSSNTSLSNPASTTTAPSTTTSVLPNIYTPVATSLPTTNASTNRPISNNGNAVPVNNANTRFANLFNPSTTNSSTSNTNTNTTSTLPPPTGSNNQYSHGITSNLTSSMYYNPNAVNTASASNHNNNTHHHGGGATSNSSSMYGSTHHGNNNGRLGGSGNTSFYSQNNTAASTMPYLNNTTAPPTTPSVTSNSTFPVILHDLLSRESRDIISWDKDGLKFTINDAKRFRSNLLPKYFGSSMDLAGFFFHLQTHGFEIMNQTEGLIFHHPLFNRNRRDLAASIHELTFPANGQGGASTIAQQPSLNSVPAYQMPAPANNSNNSFSNSSRGMNLNGMNNNQLPGLTNNMNNNNPMGNAGNPNNIPGFSGMPGANGMMPNGMPLGMPPLNQLMGMGMGMGLPGMNIPGMNMNIPGLPGLPGLNMNMNMSGLMGNNGLPDPNSNNNAVVPGNNPNGNNNANNNPNFQNNPLMNLMMGMGPGGLPGMMNPLFPGMNPMGLMNPALMMNPMLAMGMLNTNFGMPGNTPGTNPQGGNNPNGNNPNGPQNNPNQPGGFNPLGGAPGFNPFAAMPFPMGMSPFPMMGMPFGGPMAGLGLPGAGGSGGLPGFPNLMNQQNMSGQLGQTAASGVHQPNQQQSAQQTVQQQLQAQHQAQSQQQAAQQQSGQQQFAQQQFAQQQQQNPLFPPYTPAQLNTVGQATDANNFLPYGSAGLNNLPSSAATQNLPQPVSTAAALQAVVQTGTNDVTTSKATTIGSSNATNAQSTTSTMGTLDPKVLKPLLAEENRSPPGQKGARRKKNKDATDSNAVVSAESIPKNIHHNLIQASFSMTKSSTQRNSKSAESDVSDEDVASSGGSLQSTDVDEDHDFRVINRRRGRRPAMPTVVTTSSTVTFAQSTTSSKSTSKNRASTGSAKRTSNEGAEDLALTSDDDVLDIRGPRSLPSSLVANSVGNASSSATAAMTKRGKRLFLDLTASSALASPSITSGDASANANAATTAIDNTFVYGLFHGKLKAGKRSTAVVLQQYCEKRMKGGRRSSGANLLLAGNSAGRTAGLQVGRLKQPGKGKGGRRSSRGKGDDFDDEDEEEVKCSRVGVEFQTEPPALVQRPPQPVLANLLMQRQQSLPSTATFATISAVGSQRATRKTGSVQLVLEEQLASMAWMPIAKLSDDELDSLVTRVKARLSVPSLKPGSFVVVTFPSSAETPSSDISASEENSSTVSTRRFKLCCVLETIHEEQLSISQKRRLSRLLTKTSQAAKAKLSAAAAGEDNEDFDNDGSIKEVNDEVASNSSLLDNGDDTNTSLPTSLMLDAVLSETVGENTVGKEVYIRVFDGALEHFIPQSSNALSVPVNFGEDQILEALYQNNYDVEKTVQSFVPTRDLSYDILMDPKTRWNAVEARKFCNGYKRHGENIPRIYQQSYNDSRRPIEELVEFFHIFQGSLESGVQAITEVIELFRRAEDAHDGKVQSSLAPTTPTALPNGVSLFDQAKAGGDMLSGAVEEEEEDDEDDIDVEEGIEEGENHDDEDDELVSSSDSDEGDRDEEIQGMVTVTTATSIITEVVDEAAPIESELASESDEEEQTKPSTEISDEIFHEVVVPVPPAPEKIEEAVEDEEKESPTMSARKRKRGGSVSSQQSLQSQGSTSRSRGRSSSNADKTVPVIERDEHVVESVVEETPEPTPEEVKEPVNTKPEKVKETKENAKNTKEKARAVEDEADNEDDEEEEDDEYDEEAEKARIQELLKKHKRPELPIRATEGHFGYLSVYDPNNPFADLQDTADRKTRRASRGAGSGLPVDPLVEQVHKMRFCMCRKTIEFGEKYITCILGRRDVCNGWVHVWCAKLGHANPDKLRTLTDFICEECLESSSDEESEDEKAKNKRGSGAGVKRERKNTKEKEKGKEKPDEKKRRR